VLPPLAPTFTLVPFSTAQPPLCVRPTIVAFYAALPPDGSTDHFVLHWTILGADRAEIFGHSVNPQGGTFEVWNNDVQFWALWAKVDNTPDDCYAEQVIQIDPDSLE
jgi:hypothetical protein